MNKPTAWHETVVDVDGKLICNVLVDEHHQYIMVDGRPQFVKPDEAAPVHIGPCSGMAIAHAKWVRDAAKEWRNKNG
jgi:hypothetical protein